MLTDNKKDIDFDVTSQTAEENADANNYVESDTGKNETQEADDLQLTEENITRIDYNGKEIILLSTSMWVISCLAVSI